MRKLLLGLITVAAVLAAPVAWADDLSGVEMDVMDAKGTPNANSTKVLTLPAAASDKARERAQKGLDTANQARQDGRALGEATSDAARERHGKPEDPGVPPPE